MVISFVVRASTRFTVYLAEFAPKSATFGVWLTNGSSLSRSNIRRNRFFHEVIEAAAQNRLEGHAGLE